MHTSLKKAWSQGRNAFFLGVITLLSIPSSIANAQQGGGGNVPNQGGGGNTGISPSDMLQNPLGGINTIPDFIAKILDIIVKIGTPIVVIFIIYSGFLFVWARGNSEDLKKAKLTFFWTIVGAALLLGSWILAQALVGTINELK